MIDARENLPLDLVWTVVFLQCELWRRTVFHPDPSDIGTPFETLTRGAFTTPESAESWARTVAPLGGWRVVHFGAIGGHGG